MASDVGSISFVVTHRIISAFSLSLIPKLLVNASRATDVGGMHKLPNHRAAHTASLKCEVYARMLACEHH
jgi:hypothetical protein